MKSSSTTTSTNYDNGLSVDKQGEEKQEDWRTRINNSKSNILIY